MSSIQRTIKGFVATSVSLAYFGQAMNISEDAATGLAQTSQSDCSPDQFPGPDGTCLCVQFVGCPEGQVFNPSLEVCGCADPCDSSAFDCVLPSFFKEEPGFCGCSCPETKPENVDCGEWGRWDSEVCDCVCDEASESAANCFGCGCFDFATSICACNIQIGKPAKADCGEFGAWSDDTCDCLCDESSRENANCQAPLAFNKATSVCGCQCPFFDKASAGCYSNQEFNGDTCQCTCDPETVTCPNANYEVDASSCECECPPLAQITAECFGPGLNWNPGSCSCECAPECALANPFTVQDGCDCICNPELIEADNNGESICESIALPDFNQESCACECSIDAAFCNGATPYFEPSICQCICNLSQASCEEKFIFKAETCTCEPDTSAPDCIKELPDYDPQECEEPAITAPLEVVGCSWFLKSVTDTSYPDIDFEKGTGGPKVKDADECHDEDGVLRPLGKYNAPGYYGPEWFPSGQFNFYPAFSEDVYFIQAAERADKCREHSWLTRQSSECQPGQEPDLLMGSASEKSQWKLTVHEDEDSEGACIFYTVDATFFVEGVDACVDNGFRLDLMDFIDPNNVALSTAVDENDKPRKSQRFFVNDTDEVRRFCE